MTKFGKHAETPLKTLGKDAIALALNDAGLEIADIEMAFVANAMAAIVTGQVSAVGQGIFVQAGSPEFRYSTSITRVPAPPVR